MRIIWTEHNRHIKFADNEILRVWELSSGHFAIKVDGNKIGEVKKLPASNKVGAHSIKNKKGWFAAEDFYFNKPRGGVVEGPFETRDEAIDALLVKQPKKFNLKTVAQVRQAKAGRAAKASGASPRNAPLGPSHRARNGRSTRGL